MLEKWISAGDMFTSWTGDHGNLVVSAPDENGLFMARDSQGHEGEWHVNAIRPGTIRRPVASQCPIQCPRCGLDLEAAGSPYEHPWEGYGDTCSFTWRPKANDLAAWMDAAKACGLISVYHHAADELVIFNREDTDRGSLWVKAHSLEGKRDNDAQNPFHNLDPQDALALLGHLRKGLIK